jgi:hypothetical protein
MDFFFLNKKSSFSLLCKQIYCILETKVSLKEAQNSLKYGLKS